MSEQKIYVPKSSAKQVDFQNGNSILKLSFRVEDLVAFAQANVNARGYVNFGVSKRREVGQWGDTHCVWLDTWQPAAKGTAPASAAPAPAAPAEAGPAPAAPAAKVSPIEDDDVPY